MVGNRTGPRGPDGPLVPYPTPKSQRQKVAKSFPAMNFASTSNAKRTYNAKKSTCNAKKDMQRQKGKQIQRH